MRNRGASPSDGNEEVDRDSMRPLYGVQTIDTHCSSLPNFYHQKLYVMCLHKQALLSEDAPGRLQENRTYRRVAS